MQKQLQKRPDMNEQAGGTRIPMFSLPRKESRPTGFEQGSIIIGYMYIASHAYGRAVSPAKSGKIRPFSSLASK